MPFGNPVARAFTASSIRANAPALPGVYGISNSREWIFISSTDNIQASLLLHLGVDDALLGRSPSGFLFEVCHFEAQTGRCDRLIREYSPVCNVGQ
jgi:hypothetical protein